MKSIILKLLAISVALCQLPGCGSSSSNSPGASSVLMGLAVDDVITPTKLYLSDFLNNAVGFVSITGGSITSMTNASPAFSGPQGLALFGSNLYAVDALNHMVRKVATASPYTTTTYAGTGTAGNSDSPAQFYQPRNAVADATGNLYITDSVNNTVRKIASGTQVVTTIASGFNNPWGITIDSATPQNLYVTDIGTHSIKKLIPSGATWSVSVFAGNIAGNYGLPATADGTSAFFYQPLGITTDNNYLYVADSGNHAIRRISLTAPNTVELIAGSSGRTSGNYDNSTGSLALFYAPAAITYASGAVYVTDQAGTVIRKVSTTGIYPVTTIPLN